MRARLWDSGGMTENALEERPYGSRFAEAWAQLQRYLADLDETELTALSSAGVEETLRVLKQQPALGHSGALHGADEKGPEELAAAIVQERLKALTQSFGRGDARPWGAQFLEAYRSYRGSLASFRYSTIQELKSADKEEAIQILTKRLWSSAVAAKALRDSTPREAAHRLFVQGQIAAANTMAMIAFLG